MKTHVEKISELIIKGRIRLCQLSGTERNLSTLYNNNAEIMSWVINEGW